jgi:hypothetical protein
MDFVIESFEEFDGVYDHFLQDPEFSLHNTVKISEGWTPKIHYKVEGNQYDGTLTPTVMKSLISLQGDLNHVYCRIVHGTSDTSVLTKEEKEKLEIHVKVEEGSLDLDIIYKIIQEVNKMPLSAQVILGLLGAIGMISFFTYKMKRDERGNALETAKIGATTEQQKSILENHQKSLEIMERAQDKIIRTFIRSGFDRITLDDQTESYDTAKDMVKIEKPRKEKIRKVYGGKFMVNKVLIDYSKDDADFISVSSQDDAIGPLTLEKVILQKDLLAESDYTLLKEAKEKNPLQLVITTEQKNGAILNAYLDSITEL